MAARSEGNGPLDEEELRAAVEASGLSPTRCSALAAPLFAELSLSPHLGSVSDVFQVLVVIEDGLLGRAEAVDLSERLHRLYSANRERRDGHFLCLLYTSPSPRDYAASRMPSSA